MIKPIETYYNGFHFRSRLEARWAVFFDNAGIEYVYEPQGFENKAGQKYLPDFYLPEKDWYVEIKPPRDGAEEEIEKACRFIGDKNKIRVLLILGDIPKFSKTDIWFYLAIFYHPVMEELSTRWVGIVPECEFDECGNVHIQKAEFLSWIYICGEKLPPAGETIRVGKKGLTAQKESDLEDCEEYLYSDTFPDEAILFMHRLYDSARQARFEHGETPCRYCEE